jgi:hypothetical protein
MPICDETGIKLGCRCSVCTKWVEFTPRPITIKRRLVPRVFLFEGWCPDCGVGYSLTGENATPMGWESDMTDGQKRTNYTLLEVR